jgi:hypothetical protein
MSTVEEVPMKRVNVAMPTALAEIGGMEGFFAFMRERHSVYLRRQAGQPRPWTDDPILHKYKFTNVFRELDRTTIWFRENIRDRYDDPSDPAKCLYAIAVFRWFNRIETGDALFNKTDAFEQFARSHDVKYLREALMDVIGPKGPFVTGAHMVYAVPNMPLHEGVLHCIDRFVNDDGNESAFVAWDMAKNPGDFSIEWTWEWMTRSYFGLGSFLAYELATDMRHTHLLRGARDIMSWANPGPGSTRGLNRVFSRPYTARPSREKLVEEMRFLLQHTKGDWAKEYNFWPNNEQFPELEMRDIEHSLCEYDKYLRVANGDGYPRGVYR